MTMKRRIMALILIVALMSGCSSAETRTEDIRVKQVKTQEVTIQTLPEVKTYLGYVMPKDTKGYAFKSGGRIESVEVEIGDAVEVGDVLARLDTQDLELQLESARYQAASAKAQYNEVLSGAAPEEVRMLELSRDLAKKSYEMALDQAEDSQQLLENGIIAQQEYEQIQLNALNAKTSLEQVNQQLAQAQRGASQENLNMVKAQYNLANVQVKSVTMLIEDGTIIANEAGVVVDVPYQAGTLIDAGMPVVATRVNSNFLQLGLTQKDRADIEEGMSVAVNYDDKTYQGKVTFIDEFADSASGTFRVEIEPVDTPSFAIPFGSITEVTFEKEGKAGIWIPLTALLNEGIDYVFLAKDGVAIKQQVDRIGLRENQVMVTGLEEGDLVITEGILSINEGDPIELVGGDLNE